MTLRRSTETLLWIVAGAIGVGLLELMPAPRETVFWGRAYDSAHAPLFAGFALLLVRMSRLWVADRLEPLPPGAGLRPIARLLRNPYLLGYLAVGLLAGATEGLQIVTARDADVMDGVRDLIGGAAMIVFLWSLRPGPAWRAWALRLVAVATILATFVPLARCVYAYRIRAAAFPRLVAFESGTERVFFEVLGADLELGDGVGTVHYRAHTIDYPKFGFEPAPDWRGYRWLVVDVVVLGSEPVTLQLRINDYQHDRHTYSDRFNTEQRLEPGAQQIRVDLREVEHAPATRLLDLSAVDNVTFFLDHPARDATLRFDSVRLVGDSR